MQGHPFDTTKTRLQTAPKGFYSGTIDCVRKTMKWEGFSGFYSGIYSPLLGQMIFRACSFSIFHFTSRSLINTFDNNNNNSIHKETNIAPYIIAGGITGFAISFIETPIDLLKIKLQTQIFLERIDPNYKPQYKNVYECMKHITKKYGMKGLWQG